jgi:hypothetical protein
MTENMRQNTEQKNRKISSDQNQDMRTNPRISVAEALGDGRFWECEVEGYHQPF